MTEPITATVDALRIELMRQWLMNHAEQCGHEPPWPHAQRCTWPMPTVLMDAGADDVRHLMGVTTGVFMDGGAFGPPRPDVPCWSAPPKHLDVRTVDQLLADIHGNRHGLRDRLRDALGLV